MARSKECLECNSTGKYRVLNAYDTEFEEEVECEYCQPKDRRSHSLSLN